MNLNKLSKKELIKKIQDLEKKQPKEEIKEKPKIIIKNKFTNEIIYKSNKETMKEAVEEAVLSKANLSWADLSKANLSEANLSEANLSEANYWKTNFKYCKVNKKTKEQIIEIMNLKEV